MISWFGSPGTCSWPWHQIHGMTESAESEGTTRFPECSPQPCPEQPQSHILGLGIVQTGPEPGQGAAASLPWQPGVPQRASEPVQLCPSVSESVQLCPAVPQCVSEPAQLCPTVSQCQWLTDSHRFSHILRVSLSAVTSTAGRSWCRNYHQHQLCVLRCKRISVWGTGSWSEPGEEMLNVLKSALIIDFSYS